MAQKEQCFIITPIGDDTDPIRRHIEGVIDAAITPALGEEYDIVVAHKIGEPGSITKQVIDKVYHSKLVIANLTNRNPNVMYELALRHATGKPVIMIAERGTPLPSDIIMQRTIFYYNDAKGVMELREALKKAAQEINYTDKSGPVFEVLGDIRHETDMLEKAVKDNQDSKEPLEYIMMRLDKIEDVLSRYQSQTNFGVPNKNYENCVLKCSYSSGFEIDNPANRERLQSLYRKMDSFLRRLGSRIENFDPIDEDKMLYLHIDNTCRVSPNHIIECVIEVMQKEGFKNVNIMLLNN